MALADFPPPTVSYIIRRLLPNLGPAAAQALREKLLTAEDPYERNMAS